MLRRDLLKSLVLTPWVHAFPAQRARAQDRRPNIVVALTDDQRWDTVGYEGDPLAHTPHVDAMAAAGTAFRNSFVTTPICASSRASIFTSLHYATHRFNFGNDSLSLATRELFYAYQLKQAGYRTALYGKLGIWFDDSILESLLRKLRGYGLPLGHDYAALFNDYRAIDRDPYISRDEDGVERHSVDQIERAALRFIDSQPTDQPFCLSLSFNVPHKTAKAWPPAPTEAGMLDDATVPAPKLSDPEIFENLPRPLRAAFMRERYLDNWPSAEKRLNVRGYYEQVAGADRVIGHVRAALEARGMADNTVIIFASDNGLVMGERGLGGKWTHFEESIRVPLVIYDPRNPVDGGHRPEQMALNIDLAPTILDLAGVPKPSLYQGRSLLPLLTPGRAPEAWREDFYYEHEISLFGLPNWIGVRGERYKFAEYRDADGTYPFLHDLQEDPDELVNLAEDSDYDTMVDTMRAQAVAYNDRYSALRM